MYEPAVTSGGPRGARLDATGLQVAAAVAARDCDVVPLRAAPWWAAACGTAAGGCGTGPAAHPAARAARPTAASASAAARGPDLLGTGRRVECGEVATGIPSFE